MPQEEFYPIPFFVSLEVSDIRASQAWYIQALGLRTVYQTPDGRDGRPTLVHLRRERFQDLLLMPGKPAPPGLRGSGMVINLLPGEVAVQDLAQRARTAGSPQVEGPVERPWNAREVTVTDPDGYRLRFSKPIDLTKTFDEVMGAAG